MKKRKICAAITLTAFALTMMPVMGFAASGSNSSIAVDDGSAKANGEDTLKYIIDLDDELNTSQVQTGTQTVYTLAENPTTKVVLNGTYYVKTGEDSYIVATEYTEGTEYYTKDVKYTPINDMTAYIESTARLDHDYLSDGYEGSSDSTSVWDNSKHHEGMPLDTEIYYYQIVPDTTPIAEKTVGYWGKIGEWYEKVTDSNITDDKWNDVTEYCQIEYVGRGNAKSYHEITADCYYLSGDEYVNAKKGRYYSDTTTTYYTQSDKYTKVEDNTAITKLVLAQEYYNSDGSQVYAESSDYSNSVDYYTKGSEPIYGDSAAQWLYIWAERDGSYSDADLISLTADGAGASYLALDYNQIHKGETIVYVKSNIAGTVSLKAYLVKANSKPTFAEVYNGTSEILKTALTTGSMNGRFNASSSEITVSGTVTPYDGGSAGKAESFAPDTTYDMGLDANNGIDYYYVSLKLKKGGSKLVGEDVTVSIDKTGGNLNKEEITTTATGAVNFKVSATKSGTYTVTVECGTYSESFKVKFGATAISKVKVHSYTKEDIAVDSNEEVAAEFIAYDANGNAVKADSTLANDLNDIFAVEVTKAPADSSMEDEVLYDAFKYNADKSSYVYISFTPDTVGEYTLKIYHTNTGVAEYVYLTAEEFGTIKSATISYEASSYNLGSTTEAPTVKVVDANGVTKTATATRFSYTGLGVANFNSSNGVLTFKDKDDYVGSKITVSVVVNNKVSASTTITIGNEAAYLKFGEAYGAVGDEVTVTGYSVDADGALSSIGTNNNNYEVKVQSAIITSKPEGATVSIDATNFEDSTSFMNKGYGDVVVTSNKEGTVVGNVVLEVRNTENDKTFYLAGVVTVNFGKESIKDNDYSKNITMIIGAKTFVFDGGAYNTDVAPFITNGRTMIAIRALAESTGANVEYDEKTSTVTITGKNLNATMIIGSNIMTVNGETKVMDVAASITDGRTVIPVRYAAELLGYDFELTTDSKGNIIAVTMYQ